MSLSSLLCVRHVAPPGFCSNQELTNCTLASERAISVYFVFPTAAVISFTFLQEGGIQLVTLEARCLQVLILDINIIIICAVYNNTTLTGSK